MKQEITKEAKGRKDTPVYEGFIKYFPNAIKEVARNSRVGNEQHHPDEPLWWDKSKSQDEPDALIRHMIDHASGEIYDADGVRHLTKVAWRAMAWLERELDDG